MSNNALTTFTFEGQADIRVVQGEDGEPRFVAADVCKALEQPNISQVVSRLDDDEKGIQIVDTLGGAQPMLCVNESGLYALAMTSRKPEAKAFKRWITHEVLPSIRKTGQYSTQPQPVAKTPAEQALMHAQLLVDHERQLAEHDTRIARLEAHVSAAQEGYQHYSVLAYFKVKGLPAPDQLTAQRIGQQASKLSRASGHTIGKTPDPRFGSVNTYHENVLAQIVNALIDGKGR